MNAIFILTLMAVPGQAAPLVCDQPVAERGQVRGGPVLIQRFTLTNKGQATINIVEARASCGCMTPQLAARSLKAVESTTLDLNIGTLSQPEGENLWSVRLLYQIEGTEGSMPMELRVKATLVREVGIEPAALRLMGGPNLTTEITLTDRRPKPFEVIAIRTATGKIVADDSAWKQVDGNWVRKIRVRMAANCPAGKFEETLVVYGNDPDYRELRVAVNGERRDSQQYLVTPAEVKLDVKPGKPVPTTLILVRDHGGLPVEIDRVESDDPALQCRFAEGANATAAVRIGVAKNQIPVKSAKVTIYVRAPVAQTIVVPVGIQE